ncbi:MAG: hypothetical protein KC776_29210 [Myxococcales bacterium]|nr:hypothetical protein [Myxococcales bacterium]MCB9582496.1 hypothetical protein [Polyangiaceae bacterium]
MRLQTMAWMALSLGVLVGCSSDDHELGGSGGQAGSGGATGGSGGATGGSGGQAGAAGGSGGVAGSAGAESACTTAGGVVATSLCCQATGDFPNTCLVGACGCAPSSSHDVKVCNCPTDSCWDGSDCVPNGLGGAGGGGGAAGAAGSGGAGGAPSSCVSSGGTVEQNLCCNATSDFPDTCSIGACSCSPQNSHNVSVCKCPAGKCFDGTQCI